VCTDAEQQVKWPPWNACIAMARWPESKETPHRLTADRRRVLGKWPRIARIVEPVEADSDPEPIRSPKVSTQNAICPWAKKKAYLPRRRRAVCRCIIRAAKTLEDCQILSP
jgi:hypothetical protein